MYVLRDHACESLNLRRDCNQQEGESMSTPGNQELLEMVQALEQKVTELQGKLHMVENDLDDVNGRTNKLLTNMVIKADWNEGIHILKRIGALNDVDLRRGLI